MTDAPRLNLRDWAAAAEEVADPAAWEYLARGSGANVTVSAERRGVVALDAPPARAARRVDGRPVDDRARHTRSPRRSSSRRPRCTASSPTTASWRRRGPPPRSAPCSWCRWRRRTRWRTSPRPRPTAARWAQMYMLRDRGRTRALAERAAAAGYRRDRGVGRRRRGRPGHRQRVGGAAHAARLDALPEPGVGRRRRQLRHHGAGHRLRPVDHVRRPGVVRRVERAPGRREGPAAGRRRGPCRRRRRVGDRGVEPRWTGARRHRRDRRRPARRRRRGRRARRGLRRRRDPQRRRRGQGARPGCPRGDGRTTGAVGPVRRRCGRRRGGPQRCWAPSSRRRWRSAARRRSTTSPATSWCVVRGDVPRDWSRGSRRFATSCAPRTSPTAGTSSR